MPSNQLDTRPFDPVKLGRRLAEARANARLTQEEAADQIGVLRTAIAQVETGVRAVSTDELFKLARLYGRNIDYFFQSEEDAAQEDALTVLGRMAPEIQDDPVTGTAIRRLVTVCQAGADLKAELGLAERPGPPAYAQPQPKNVGEAVEQGTAVAEQERKRLDLGEAPIADIHELIAAQNVWAASDHLPGEISGLFFNHRSTGMVVVVNHDHNRFRQRFSYAHEYAHALLDRDLKVTYTSRDNAKSLVESRANAFAAAFLMPKKGVETALADLDKGKPSKFLFSTYDVAGDIGTEGERRTPPGSQRLSVKDAAYLAMYFDVSYEVSCYRLRSLGYVNQAELDALIERKDAGSTFLRLAGGCAQKEQKGATNGFGTHIVSQLLPLIIEAYQREIISRGKLLDLCSLIRVGGSDVLEIAQIR